MQARPRAAILAILATRPCWDSGVGTPTKGVMSGYYATAVKDVSSGLAAWRIWTMLASNDIKQRYRRSTLGQFWLTLSMATMIFSMGAVYSILFNIEIKTFIPYLAVSLVMWGFISSAINESANAFTENERIILHTNVAQSTFIYRMICRNSLVLAHNILIVPIVFVVFGIGINANIFWLIPGLLLVGLNCFWIAYFIAIVCARYRDVPQIIASVMQIMFFVTPVMFRPSQLGSHAYILLMNPLASFLEVIRDPILGQAPSAASLAICVGLLLFGSLLTLAFVGRYGWRIVYWL